MTLLTKTPAPASRPNPKSADHIRWDDEVPELGLRERGSSAGWLVSLGPVRASKHKALGNARHLTREAARIMARALIEATDSDALPPDPKVKLVAFLETYLIDCRGQWKPSTFRAHESALRAQILPALGTVRVCDLTPALVVTWLGNMAQAPATRNRALALLSGAMRHAELLGLRPAGSNPCEGLRRRQSSFKAQYLDGYGYAAMEQVLREAEAQHPVPVAFIRFLALTGARRGEAEAVTWDMLDSKRLALPDSKSGPRAIWLGKPARDLLAGLPKGKGLIFVGSSLTQFQRQVDQVWARVRSTLARPKLRLHDLRHSFASVAVNRGLSLQVIGGLLGHADQMTTAGYAHLDERRLQAASQRVGDHFDKISAGRSRVKPDCPFRAFERSSATLTRFCADQGLDPTTFRRELIAWRKKETRA